MRLSGAFCIKRLLIVKQVLQVGGGSNTALYKRASEIEALSGGAYKRDASCEGGIGTEGASVEGASVGGASVGGKEEVFDFVGGVFEDNCIKAQGIIGARKDIFALYKVAYICFNILIKTFFSRELSITLRTGVILYKGG